MKNIEKIFGIDIKGWSMSEKFDGVQGVWDGKALRTRTGNFINAPKWWADTLPDTPLKGELWIGYQSQDFDKVRSAIQSKRTSPYWSEIKFLVFHAVKQELGPYSEVVNQSKIKEKDNLMNLYRDVIFNGGEGLVITAPNGEQYKMKPKKDDDGELVGFTDGKGRNTGMIGAFVLKLRNGRELKIGGIDDCLRSIPPKIGSIIKFTYEGLTSTGLPRFARFAGIRAEATLEF